MPGVNLLDQSSQMIPASHLEESEPSQRPSQNTATPIALPMKQHSASMGPPGMLNYYQGNLIARLAPIKEDSYEKKLGPGSYDPIKPGLNLGHGGASVWGKSKDKRKLWYEGHLD
jgi:hypothetical protein